MSGARTHLQITPQACVVCEQHSALLHVEHQVFRAHQGATGPEAHQLHSPVLLTHRHRRRELKQPQTHQRPGADQVDQHLAAAAKVHGPAKAPADGHHPPQSAAIGQRPARQKGAAAAQRLGSQQQQRHKGDVDRAKGNPQPSHSAWLHLCQISSRAG